MNRFMEKKSYWRGVEGVTMIWHGEWSDPELEHDGKVANYWDVENTMWERYKDLARSEGYTEDELNELGEAGFNKYCQKYKDEVYELIEMCSK